MPAAGVLAQAGEGGLPPIVMFGLVAVISFLAFRWVFRRRSRQRRGSREGSTDHDDGGGGDDGDGDGGDGE